SSSSSEVMTLIQCLCRPEPDDSIAHKTADRRTTNPGCGSPDPGDRILLSGDGDRARDREPERLGGERLLHGDVAGRPGRARDDAGAVAGELGEDEVDPPADPLGDERRIGR